MNGPGTENSPFFCKEVETVKPPGAIIRENPYDVLMWSGSGLPLKIWVVGQSDFHRRKKGRL
jgi:hypothetical protein